MKTMQISRHTLSVVLALIPVLMVLPVSAQADGGATEQGRETVESAGWTEAGGFELLFAGPSRVLIGLRSAGADGFNFLPTDRLDQRREPGFYHLGDVFFDVRVGGPDGWQRYSTLTRRDGASAVQREDEHVIDATDLTATLGAGVPLRVMRTWRVEGGDLVLAFDLENTSAQPVEVGTLGVPMVFNNIITDRSLEESHETCVFVDPYIGQDAGYLQVTRLNGQGPALVVMPEADAPLEGWQVLDEPMYRGQTFEGHFAWLSHTKALAETRWQAATPWNPPTSRVLQPGERMTHALRLALSPSIRAIEQTLASRRRPVAVGVPGYILPQDIDGRLFLKHHAAVARLTVEPAETINITPIDSPSEGVQAYALEPRGRGRARITVDYEDGTRQTIHYYLTKPAAEVVDDYTRFLLTEQWFEDPDDPFGRSPSVISYDREANEPVTQEPRAWIAGLSDEGGAGSWLGAGMALYISPESEQVEQFERFVHGVLWGGIQVDEGERMYGVRKSMFFYSPEDMPEGYYDTDTDWSTWASWNPQGAADLGRSYNYPHVAAVYWGLYRIARYHTGYDGAHDWAWYLTQAYRTGIAMVEHAPHYAVHGQMEGTVFVRILEDLQREGWDEQADQYEAVMRRRAEVWSREAYPFGSEMAWDSTGQEEVYAWCRYFGHRDKAEVSLNSILGYMPTVPHWGYNGSARRYWDFWYAGKLPRLERQLHHYGSGLNAIPVLDAYRSDPDDFYLLRVGYGGLMGNLTNIDRDGFGSAAFHSFPETLAWDGYSGDYGCGFTGHALNAATYLVRHPEFGWVGFGGNVSVRDGTVTIQPRDAIRRRVFIAPIALWLELDAGQFEAVSYHPGDGSVSVTVQGGTMADTAYLSWTDLSGERSYNASGNHAELNGALAVPVDDGSAIVTLEPIAR